ncbi:MAG: diguanylate cyclase [Acidobacteriota bacterium]
MENKAKDLLEQIAEESGLAVVVLNESGSEVLAANNNSICSLLYSTEGFASKCAEFCGKALKVSRGEQGPIEYRCYAGLDCRAVALNKGNERLVAIVGRTFTKADNYRNATDRAVNGDWQQFSPDKLFENILLSGSDANLKNLFERLSNLSTDEVDAIFDTAVSARNDVNVAATDENILEIDDASRETSAVDEETLEEILEIEPRIDERLIESTQDEITAWRSLFGSLLELDYTRACASILEFLANRYEIASLLWLERRDTVLEYVAGFGELDERAIKIAIPTNEPRLLAAAHEGTALELSESRSQGSLEKPRVISIFPVTVGADIRGVLAVTGKIADRERIQQISRFCRTVASQVEILRLRGEVARRDSLADAVKRFNENLRKIDGADFWLHLTQASAELLHAERASLLIRKDASEALLPIASIGVRTDLTRAVNIGARVARHTLENGKPLLVKDVNKVKLKTSSPDRKYRTPSFISYPIAIGERGVAVLNLTDKADGAAFSEHDLDVLRAIMPQIAVAIDRTALKEQAGAYAQLSVTDSLTGLMNRRYIETRLSEEIRRSNRHGFPMSFMMLDVDDFKAYNDQFGHPEGDEALKLVGQVIKDTVRGADVASRYGGEEFAILLPQTTAEEAEAIAERIRQTIEGTVFPARRVTVSIGIASISLSINSMRALISASDKALYQAKRSGRNNVQSYGNIEGFIENIQ